jgi:hypothetical protein
MPGAKELQFCNQTIIVAIRNYAEAALFRFFLNSGSGICRLLYLILCIKKYEYEQNYHPYSFFAS